MKLLLLLLPSCPIDYTGRHLNASESGRSEYYGGVDVRVRVGWFMMHAWCMLPRYGEGRHHLDTSMKSGDRAGREPGALCERFV